MFTANVGINFISKSLAKSISLASYLLYVHYIKSPSQGAIEL